MFPLTMPMNPNLSPSQTIIIGITIAGITLLIVTTLLTLTYAYEQDSQGLTSALLLSLDTMSNQPLYDPYGYDQQQLSLLRPTTASFRGPSQQGMSMTPHRIGRISHEMQPQGPAIPAGPQPLKQPMPQRQGTYGLQTQMTYGPRQRLMYLTMTPIFPSARGPVPLSTSNSDNGTSPSRYWTPLTSPNPSTQFPPISSGWRWEH
ncbi:hypothetical protein EDD85DRAFT_955946 [Armillaria nabsnona]|nr:hypothetical protein EDD85DRAFT_955946 [Armillaria nabsnona]